MSTSRLRLSSFADQFPAEMRDEIEKTVEALIEKTGSALDELIDEPVATGTLRASRQLTESKGGLRMGWTAPSAVGVDIGRIKSKTYRRTLPSGKKTRPFSRMLGSEKRPEGFTQPALEGLKSRWEQVAAEAGEELR